MKKITDRMLARRRRHAGSGDARRTSPTTSPAAPSAPSAKPAPGRRKVSSTNSVTNSLAASGEAGAAAAAARISRPANSSPKTKSKPSSLAHDPGWETSRFRRNGLVSDQAANPTPTGQRPGRRRLESIPERHAPDRSRASRPAVTCRVIAITRSSPSPGNCRMCLIEMGMPKMGPDRKPVLGAGRQAEDQLDAASADLLRARDVAEGLGVRTNSPLVEECRRGRDGISPHQSSARLPDLRPGGRMPAAGIQRRVRPPGFALPREQSEEAEERRARPARHARRRALHPLLALHSLLARRSRRTTCSASSIAAATPTLTAHPGKRLENNYSLNTVDICPVGALTSHGFPLQDAGLVSEGNEELLHQLRDRLQHRHRHARRRHLSADAARERRRELLLDVRLRPAEFRLPAKRSPPARAAGARGAKAAAGDVEEHAIEAVGRAAAALRRLADRDPRVRPDDERRTLAHLAPCGIVRRDADRHRAAHRARATTFS